VGIHWERFVQFLECRPLGLHSVAFAKFLHGWAHLLGKELRGDPGDIAVNGNNGELLMHEEDELEKLLVQCRPEELVVKDVEGGEADKLEALVSLVGLANSQLEVIKDLLDVDRELVADHHIFRDRNQAGVVILLLVRVLADREKKKKKKKRDWSHVGKLKPKDRFF